MFASHRSLGPLFPPREQGELIAKSAERTQAVADGVSQQLGPRLKVVAIIDPAEEVAKRRLDVKRSSFVEMAYRNTRICPSLDDFVSTMKDDERPHAFIVGSPAAFRGSTQQGRDFELQVLKHFPKNTPAVRRHIVVCSF